MGGFMKSAPAPLPPVAPPVPAPAEDAAALAATAAQERRRRAMGETIATSYRGVVGQSVQPGARKLIGE